MQRSLTIFVLLIAAILISSCKKGKPLVVESCIIINDEQIGFCINNRTREERDIYLQEMNKYTCHSPRDWAKIRTFILTHSRNQETFNFFNLINKALSKR